MKTLTEFLTALAVLAIAQYVTIALGIVLLIVAVMAATIHPRQAFATAVLIAILTFAVKQPVACAAALSAIGIAVVLADRTKRQPVSTPPAPLMLSHTPADQTDNSS